VYHVCEVSHEDDRLMVEVGEEGSEGGRGLEGAEASVDAVGATFSLLLLLSHCAEYIS